MHNVSKAQREEKATSAALSFITATKVVGGAADQTAQAPPKRTVPLGTAPLSDVT